MTGRDVSVVIPTYGRQPLLERAVRSVLEADPSAEVVVVDDASPDPVVAPEGSRLVRLDENLGAGGARNAGVVASTRPIIGFLDSDDTWDHDRLSLTLPAIATTPIVLCWATWEGDLNHSGRLLEGDIVDVVANATTPHLGATLFLRDVWEPFDEGFRTCEDIEWWTRIAARGPATTIPRVLCHMGRHDGERHRSGTDRRIADSERLLAMSYFRQHRKARAFRLRRMASMASSLGDAGTARSYAARALVAHPSPGSLARLVRYAVAGAQGPR